MKHRLLAVVSVATTCWLGALGVQTVQINFADGGVARVKVDDGTKIDLVDGNMRLTTTGEGTTFDYPVAGMTSFAFSDQGPVTGIGETAGEPDFTITHTGAEIHIESTHGTNLDISLHDSAGTLLRHINSADTYTLEIDGLAAGIYILTVNGHSIKFLH